MLVVIVEMSKFMNFFCSESESSDNESPPSPAKSTSSVESSGTTSSASSASSTASVQYIGAVPGPLTYFHPLDAQTRSNICKTFNLINRKKIENDYKNVGSLCIEKAKHQKKMERDGNCYFRAISVALTGHQTAHLKMRQLICEYIEIHGTFEDDPGDVYLAKSNMKEMATWATETELHATAQLFKCDLYVYHKYGKLGLKWLKFECHSKQKHKQSIYLDNRHGNHFDFVIGI